MTEVAQGEGVVAVLTEPSDESKLKKADFNSMELGKQYWLKGASGQFIAFEKANATHGRRQDNGKLCCHADDTSMWIEEKLEPEVA